MKIVMLTDLYDERLQYQDNLIGQYYVKHGHEVTVLAATFDSAFDYYADQYDPRAPQREYFDGGVKIIKLPYSLNILNKLRKFGGVRAILVREAPDLIFSHDIHLNLSDATWYRRRNPDCRIIMDCHSDYSNSAKNWLSLNVLHKMIRKGFLHWHRRHISRFFPVVPASAVFLNEVYGIGFDDMELLPLGADSDLAKEMIAGNVGAAIRNELGIPSDAFVVFTGGKFTPLKKTHLLIEACVQLNDPNLHLLLVGDSGPERAEYQQQLHASAAAHPRIHFIGWVDGNDVYRYMNAADLAVFPASQSVLWQQAVSMGLPMIVGAGKRTGDQDPSYMNLHGNIIILAFEDIRSEVLAREIRRLAGDRSTLRSMRSAALRTSDELLNYDRIVEMTLR